MKKNFKGKKATLKKVGLVGLVGLAGVMLTVVAAPIQGVHAATTSVIAQPTGPVLALNKASETMNVGSSYNGLYTNIANITAADFNNLAVKWTSSNTAIATVDSKGVVTSYKAGQVTITATLISTGQSASCVMTVLANTDTTNTSTGPVLALNKASETMNVGSSFNGLYTKISNITTADLNNLAVKWTSNNTAIATVDSKGVVTSYKAGKVTITATLVSTGQSASCVMTIVQ